MDRRTQYLVGTLSVAVGYMVENTAGLVAIEDTMGRAVRQGIIGAQVPERQVNLIELSAYETRSALRGVHECLGNLVALCAGDLPGLDVELRQVFAQRIQFDPPLERDDQFVERFQALLLRVFEQIRGVADELEAWVNQYRTATADRYDRDINERFRTAYNYQAMHMRAQDIRDKTRFLYAVAGVVDAARKARAEEDARLEAIRQANAKAARALRRAQHLQHEATRIRRRAAVPAGGGGEPLTPSEESSWESASGGGDSD